MARARQFILLGLRNFVSAWCSSRLGELDAWEFAIREPSG